MTCELCLTTSTFNPITMVSDSSYNHSCRNCSEVTNLISNFVSSAHQLYHTDLQRKFNSICPTFFNGNLFFAKPDLIKLYGFDENNVIRQLTTRLDLTNTNYSSQKDINNVCNQLMGWLIHQLSELIEQNPKGYVISLLNALEYNLYLTNTIIVWLNDKSKKVKPEDIKDTLGRIILQSLKFQRDHDYHRNFNSIYKKWETVLTIDKLSLQYGIELINHLSSKTTDKKQPFDPKIYGDIFSLVRAIYTLLHEKDTVLENLSDGQKLIIDSYGEVHSSKSITFDLFAEAYVSGMINRISNDIPDNFKKEFDIVCKIHLGLTHSNLSELATNLPEYYPHTDEFLIGDKLAFQELFKHVLNCSNIESEKVFSLFFNTSQNEFEYATSTKLRVNRPLRKCIFEITQGILAVPIQLLSYSAMAVYMDIIDGRIPEGDFQKALFKINSGLHENFELQVMNFLQKKFPDAICRNDILKDNSIFDKESNSFVSLSGQIDILFFYKNKLLIIECKDVALKFSAKSVGNEVNKFRKINRNSYQNKLRNKVQEAYNNWDAFMNYLDISDINIEKKESLGLFVTSNFTAAFLEKDLLFPVIPLSKLEDWIIQNFVE